MASQPPPAPRPTRTAPPRHGVASTSNHPQSQPQGMRRLGMLPTPGGGPRESLDSNQDPSYDSSGSFLGSLQAGRGAASRLPSNMINRPNTTTTSTSNSGQPSTPVMMMANPQSRPNNKGRGMGGFESPLAGHANRLMGGAGHGGGLPTAPRSPAGMPQSDGSFSVVKDEDEANNSGLLDLAPNYVGMKMMISKASRGGGRIQRGGSSHHNNLNSNISRNNPNGGRLGYGSSPLGLSSLSDNRNPSLDTSSNNPLDNKNRFEKSNSNPKSTPINKGKRKARGDGNSTEEEEEEEGDQVESSIRETGSVIEHSLAAEESSILEDAMLDYDYDYLQLDPQDVDKAQINLASKLRKWRQEAYGAHKYEMAIFWGDKVLAFESE